MPRGKKRVAVERTLTIADAVSEAYGELEALGEEMREAFDNTPESLQSSAAGEARSEAADALENIQEPDVDEELGKIEIKWSALPPLKNQSRSDRRDDAVFVIDRVMEFLDEMEGQKAAAEELHSALSDMKDEAEAVEFPGRNG